MSIDLRKKKFVYHRALNTEVAFKEFLAKNEASPYTLAAEGDVCWAYINGAFVIYIHHPDVQGKSLSNERVAELLQQDKLFTLEKLFSINSDVNFILELKTGNGDIAAFFEAFKETLKRHNVQNVIVDAFSVEQLKGLKKVMPGIKTSFHTKFLVGKYVLETTYQKPYIRLHNIYNMNYIDYFTISYKTTHVNYLNLDINRAYADIFKADKSLNLGAIKSMKAFEKAVHSKAEYIYLRSKTVLSSYEKALEKLLT